MATEFAIASPRPLPVIILADVSGSMEEDGNIHTMNAALKDMLRAFREESRLRAEIQVALITFGDTATVAHTLQPAHTVAPWPDLTAHGMTPMGKAIELARAMLEDKDQVPSRAYRPVVVLVSDGQPNDEWEKPLAAFAASERASKATRFAMGIGNGADMAVLRRFANDREAPVFHAHQARDIHRFFRAVTMSVAQRTQSNSPNDPVPLKVVDLPADDLDLDNL